MNDIHMQQIMKHYIDDFEKLNDPEHMEYYKWQIVKKFRPMMDEVLQTDDSAFAEKLMEGLWKNGGLKFEGSGWHFTLPELYIKTKQYDKALQFLEYLKRKKPGYADKAMKYMERVQKLKEKAESKKG